MIVDPIMTAKVYCQVNGLLELIIIIRGVATTTHYHGAIVILVQFLSNAVVIGRKVKIAELFGQVFVSNLVQITGQLLV